MGAGRWTERGGALIARLGAEERLGAIGCALIAASLLFPWYGLDLAGGVSKTGLNVFGPIEAALLVTAIAAAALISFCASDYRLPRPLGEGGLLIAAGAWSALLALYRVADRPEFSFAPEETTGLRYGILVALGGAALLTVAGLRLRRTR